MPVATVVKQLTFGFHEGLHPLLSLALSILTELWKLVSQRSISRHYGKLCPNTDILLAVSVKFSSKIKVATYPLRRPKVEHMEEDLALQQHILMTSYFGHLNRDCLRTKDLAHEIDLIVIAARFPF